MAEGRISVRRSPPASTPRVVAAEGGFTIVELMVVVVIVSILAAMVLPSLAGDKQEDAARAFGSSIARDLQRAQIGAVSNRRDMHAYVFLDRVEFREAQAAPLAGDPPVPPVDTNPPVRVVNAPLGMQLWNVTTDGAVPPTAAVLDTSTYAEIRFDPQGRATLVGNDPPPPIFIWARQTELPAGHPARDVLIEILPLTGFIRLRTAWL